MVINILYLATYHNNIFPDIFFISFLPICLFLFNVKSTTCCQEVRWNVKKKKKFSTKCQQTVSQVNIIVTAANIRLLPLLVVNMCCQDFHTQLLVLQSMIWSGVPVDTHSVRLIDALVVKVHNLTALTDLEVIYHLQWDLQVHRACQHVHSKLKNKHK